MPFCSRFRLRFRVPFSCIAFVTCLVSSGCLVSTVTPSQATAATTAATTETAATPETAAAAGAISLSSSAYNVSKTAGYITIYVTRTGGAGGAASVSYTTADNVAKAGTDYTKESGVLSWANGDAATKYFAVPIVNAANFKGQKTFYVLLAGAKTAALGAIKSAPVTIRAGWSGVLSLSAASYRVVQNTVTLSVGVTRTGGSSGAVTVGYGTADSTAKSGTDYTKASGVLKWADGDAATKTFSVPISNARPFLGSKTFAVALASATNGAAIGTGNAVSTIVGDAPVPTNPSAAMGQVGASRLLAQATFGATLDGVAAASTETYAAWFAAQAAIAPSLYAPSVPNDTTNWYPFWLTNAVMCKDQLRQRMAFALSEILVLSNNGGALVYQNQSIAAYYDILVKGALGNYRTLLQNVTLSAQMGLYLSMYRNDKANPTLGTHADENYAREVMQLFSVGLNELNVDGSVKTSGGVPVPVFDQSNVEALARVFTGWASTPTAHPYGESSWLYDDDKLDPMVAYPDHHDEDAKTILGNVTLAAGGSPAGDLKTALDTIFNHPNTGPFLGKQLIQRLVTSNPSAAYVARVAAVFNNNGSGVRGDLLAVAKAILTDPEAIAVKGYGKLREPLLRQINLWRAFNAADSTGRITEYIVTTDSLIEYDEAPLQSPTVFNFFRPDYQRSGPLTNAGLVVPEFQITNENTLVLATNELLTESYRFIDSKGVKHAGYQGWSEVGSLTSSDVLLKTAEWERYAATPETLVDELNLILMQGQMSAAMKATLVNYVTLIPATTPANRVVEAANLVISSPQYSIQR